jgi:hypothetical protein
MSKNKTPGRLHHPILTLFDDNANSFIQNLYYRQCDGKSGQAFIQFPLS